MDEAQIGQRLTAIEARLLRIEQELTFTTPDTPLPKPKAYAPSPSPALKLRPEDPSDSKPGNWLGIIAVICFVLAAAFIVKLSVETGWLTAERQIGLAALLGLGLIGCGFALLNSDRAYASLLPGAGIIVLYLTVFSAHRYYQLVSFETAIALTGLVSAICIWIYGWIKHDAYVITAAAGAYLAPAILGLNAEALFSLYYCLICSATFAIISVWMESRALMLVSSYLAILVSGGIGVELGQDGLVAGLLALHFVIFALGSYFYAAKNGAPLNPDESLSLLPVLLIFYALEYYLIDRAYPGFAPWASLGFAGLLLGLYLSARKLFPDGLASQTLILAFATITAFHSVYLELLPADVRPWLFSVIMLAFAIAPFDWSTSKHNVAYRLPVLALCSIVAIEYVTMLSHLWNDDEASWLASSAAAFASLWIVLLFAKNKLVEQRTYGDSLLGAAHLLAILGLYRLTHEIGSLAVSASWLFYAVAVLTASFLRKDEIMAKSALFVLAFAAGKALLYDAASAPTIVRIFCLLLTGVVLYGCGLFMRRIGNWGVAAE